MEGRAVTLPAENTRVAFQAPPSHLVPLGVCPEQ